MNNETFTLQIENNREGALRFMRIISAFFILSLTLYFYYAITSISLGVYLIIVIIFLSVLTIIGLITKHIYVTKASVCLYSVASISFLLIGLWPAALVIAIIGLFDLLSLRKWVVTVTNQFIKYPALLKPIIQWTEVDNVICKDGLLSIDFKTNRLIQHKVLNTEAINENHFNDFCRERLIPINKNAGLNY